MNPIPREYDVTFAVKEWLIEEDWSVLAFNPPGSQGTFTIPNPTKEKGYKGQSGSKAPDIVAVKKSKLLLVESKDYFKKSDVKKLRSLAENPERKKILYRIVKNVSEAQEISFDTDSELIVAKAHGGNVHEVKDVSTFLVKTDKEWDPEKIEDIENILNHFEVNFYPPEQKDLTENF